ncbi:MAG TPA: RelA/SpoT family protein [Candidatus Paraprevotella stercorigallinarum]|nr:RelA/SpoT family protein [Candidatus Paraprevotella stercorigallinarum]
MEDIMQKQLDDEKMVNDAYQHLIDTYLASRHRKKVDIINKAFNFAKQAHKGVRRLSGEPYIMHPIAVAQIVCGEIGLGSTSICAALLHDVVEDTDYTVEDISNIFGPKIALIVDGLTKISGGIFGDKASAQAESFKKLLLTMSDDIRVILIKISDRLHNMRTLGSQQPNKQYKIAGETLYIYAPLANRLGLNKIKEELEDLSFKYEHPEEYRQIVDKLARTQAQRDSVFEEFTLPIREELDRLGVNYTIKARIKTPYSIWCKMQNKHIGFEEIYDILAVRIIFEPQKSEDEITECFQIYVCASKIYKPHPERLRDWLNHPKANGYQALHVTLMSKTGQWIEVQIRSKRMDEMAEQGFAAHWKYKEGSKTAVDSENELEKWLHTIKEILDDPQPNALDFLDAIKLNLYASEIFVVTPKGEFKTMPADCTALDFAFSIHTFLGSHCIGAKVNHKLVPLSHKLHSGDQVEILTSKTQRVQKEWINFATTAKAKGKIQAILRREEREFQKQGEDILNEFFEKADIEPNSMNIDKLCDLHHIKFREDLFLAIGNKKVVLGQEDLDVLHNKSQTKTESSWTQYIPFLKRKKNKITHKEQESQTDNPVVTLNKKNVVLNEENIKRFVIAECCHPIPGDDVLGYIDNNQRVYIHKRQCPIAAKLKASDGNHIIAATWDIHKTLYFPVTLKINGIDHIGILHQLTGVLSDQLNININKLTVTTTDGIFESEIQLGVHDVEDVKSICQNLKAIEGIEEVTRIS